ncbi:MAG: hypothetical protein AAFV07_12655 [Bacteroidota bacterium]
MIRKFLWRLAGSDPELLATCPTDQARFEAFGFSLMISIGIGIASLTLLLYKILGFHPLLLLPVTLYLGYVLSGPNRWGMKSIHTYPKAFIFTVLFTYNLICAFIYSLACVWSLFEEQILLTQASGGAPQAENAVTGMLSEIHSLGDLLALTPELKFLGLAIYLTIFLSQMLPLLVRLLTPSGMHDRLIKGIKYVESTYIS